MKKHFYFLSLFLGLAVSMTGFTSCCNDDDTTTPQPQEQAVTPSLGVDFASIDPQFVVNGENGEQYVQLTAGESLDMPFKVEPAELASQIVLTSSDESICAVEGLKLLAKKAGKTTITAKAGEATTSFVVEVKKPGDRDADGNLKISEINFPDENFRNRLLNQFYGSDGVLTEEEIAEVTQIDVIGKGIESLQGIEFFTALKYLYCSDNQLTSLDVTKNTALQRLDCDGNKLTSLDVSGCTALQRLDCNSNKLTSLDVTKNTVLTSLYCNSNQLTSLDVSGCTVLAMLDCQDNQLTSLDVTKNTALQVLNCSRNQLTSLDVTKNTELAWLICNDNLITSLDLSKNTKLTMLECDKGSVEVTLPEKN